MGWQIDYEQSAKDTLRAYGVPKESEIIGYLKWVVEEDDSDPRRVGLKNGGEWRYGTKGTVIEVKIIDSAKKIVVLAIR